MGEPERRTLQFLIKYENQIASIVEVPGNKGWIRLQATLNQAGTTKVFLVSAMENPKNRARIDRWLAMFQQTAN